MNISKDKKNQLKNTKEPKLVWYISIAECKIHISNKMLVF